MSLTDTVGLAVVLVIVGCLALIIARQQLMLRSPGGIPLAVQTRGNRWTYGIGRYDGDELQWFRALGIGTRPSRSLRRDELRVLSRAPAAGDDLASLPPDAVIVRCRDSVGSITLGLSDSAYTGFVSWLEASAPRF